MRSLKNQLSGFAKAQWALTGSIALLGIVFYVFAYRPQDAHRAALDARIAKTTEELLLCRDETKILNSVAVDVERLQARLHSFKTLPKQQDLAQFIRDIAQLGQQASLRKFEQRQGVPIKGDKLNTQPITLSFEGDFVSVYSFLRHIEELQRLTRVSQMSVKARDRTDRSGQVKVQLTMNIYFSAE